MPKSKGKPELKVLVCWSLSLAKMKGMWLAAWKVLRERGTCLGQGLQEVPKAEFI